MVKIKVLLVARYLNPREPLAITKLFKIAEYPICPRKDDNIEYQDDWALSEIDYIYLCFNHIEIGLSARFNAEEFEKLENLGWSKELPNLN